MSSWESREVSLLIFENFLSKYERTQGCVAFLQSACSTQWAGFCWPVDIELSRAGSPQSLIVLFHKMDITSSTAAWS